MILQKRSSLLILLATLLWALDLLIRYPVTLKLSYIHIVFIESLLGLVIILPWLIRRGVKGLASFGLQEWLLAMFLGGFGMTLAGHLSTLAIREVTPGTFSFLQIFQPLLVLYGAHYFLKEKIDYLYFYAFLWVVLSAMLMYSQDLELMFRHPESMAPWSSMFIAILTMLIWGSCTIAAKKLLLRIDPMLLVASRWIFAFVFATFFLPFEDRSIPFDALFNLDTIFRFLFFSVIAGTISMYLYYRGLKNLAAAKVSFLELSFPAFGLLLSGIYVYEKIDFLPLLGAVSFFAFIFVLIARKEIQEVLTLKFTRE